MGAAETGSGALATSFLPLDRVDLRLCAEAERLRLAAAGDALPDSSALMFSMVAA
jgi:hypothetical protein